MIAALVFDFDGVLADSEPLHLRAYQEVLEPLGASLPREEYYARYLGYDDDGVFQALAASAELGDRRARTSQALIAEKTTRLRGAARRAAIVLYPGAAECVARLAADYPLGIASGALRHEIEAMLRSARPRSVLPLHRRVRRHAGQQARARSVPPGRRSCTAGRRIAASRSRTRAGASNRPRPPACGASGITNTYPVSELLEADAIITSLDELTPS